MNDYRVYAFSEKGGYNEYLYSAKTLVDAAIHHNELHPGEEITKIEKFTYLKR